MINAQKEIANLYINKLRAIDPYCILAGGAPRDWYFNQTASDLDICVYVGNQNPTYNSIMLRLKALDIKGTWLGLEDFGANYETNPHIVGVFHVLHPSQSIQIIFLRIECFSVINTFPLSLSKIWYTPERGIVPEVDFKITVKTNTVFKTNKTYADGDKYILKIKSKFPNYYFDLSENGRFGCINYIINTL